MKNFLLLFLLFSSLFVSAQQQTVTYSVNPSAFEETTLITIIINGNSVNEATWGVAGNALYLWAWSFDINDANIQDCPSNGTWTSSSETNRLTYNAGTDTYSMTITPTTFYNRVGIGRIGFLVKAKNGTGDKKSQDILIEVGLFQVNLTAPLENSSTILNSGGSLNINANNTNGLASYVLKSNGITIDSNPSTSTYSYSHTNLTNNQNYQLEVTQGAITQTKSFTVLVAPTVVNQAMPAGMEDGINYDSSDPTKATLVIDAPGKDFIYVAGSFNNWQPDGSYSMRKDTAPQSTKFWLELTGLIPQQEYSYQYWVVDQFPAVTNSPVLVKTADPYSTLVLSPFDDNGIPSNTYPNIPAYPIGQQREVTVLQTGQTSYNWQITNFTKPLKDDLVIYEVLVRDFDANRNYQDLINKIDYFKNLKVNAIQLMPIMEFEGNESWGYNTSFHLALDKFYGTKDKLKEFIDLCHQNGIAVILDVALNHAFGRNPLVRMWMNDPDGDGWGPPSSDNPYFNQVATHSYSVGEDFNHQRPRTQYYVQRVVKYWIEEFKIDGFRWDLTKGFTQNCTGNEGCTNQPQQDRIDILTDYANYSWGIDPTHYVIFEHLGQDSEELQWANLGINEGKGVMMWGKMTDQYNQLSMGFNSNNNITRMSHSEHGFIGKRLIGYSESHDEERLMYKNLQFGSIVNSSHNVRTLPIALSRMSAIGAVSIPIPGPKMIWHFGALGWEKSIYTCTDGTVNTESDPTAGNCKLDTKPQPQWTENWLSNTERLKIYNDWARLIDLKKNEEVFRGSFSINSGTTLTPKIYIWNNSLPNLNSVVILSNFNVTDQNIVPNFPSTGLWYDLMDNSVFSVSNTATPINIPAGQFRIFGNGQALLSTENFQFDDSVSLAPNPVSNSFTISVVTTKVEVYSITGQIVKSFKNTFDQNHSFDVSELNKGIYFVRATDENGREKTMKLLKN